MVKCIICEEPILDNQRCFHKDQVPYVHYLCVNASKAYFNHGYKYKSNFPFGIGKLKPDLAYLDSKYYGR